MALLNIDFEGGNNTDNSKNNISTTESPNKQEDVTSLGGADVVDIHNTDENTTTQTTTTDDNNSKTDDTNNLSTGGLVVGDQLEIDGVNYTVAENGDIVDDKGVVFKEAKDVAEWLKSMDVSDNNDNDTLNINNIQEAVGITITDDNGNPVEFTDTPDGVKSYIDSVINLRSNELQQAAVNRLYQDNPLLKQFQDYVQLKGTARGFGDIPDRSGIKLDKNNENQLVAVIKMSAEEFGNKSLNDNYINYLRDSGSLFEEAQRQLTALVEKDKAYKKEIETQAALQREQEANNVKTYWEKVSNVINSRVIAGYKIPDSFTKEVDGKKVVVTPNDFFNYLSNASFETESGRKITAYQNDLNNLTDDEFMAREMLDAWLMFTGGTYKDLVDMAVKENEVRKLIVRSKQSRSAKTVKVVKKQNGKTSIDNIVL